METALINVAQIFLAKINKLEAKLAGADCSLSIRISCDRYEHKPKIALEAHFHDGQSYHTVKAASLGALMDEVYRRAGFADRQILALDQVEASLVALPSPDA